MKLALASLALPLFHMEAADYAIEKTTADGIAIVKLIDKTHATEVAVVPSIGNNAYEMKVHGKNVFWSPYTTLAELKAKPTLQGNPMLAPWANRIDSTSYWANGKKYRLNEGLGNLRMDGFKQPIHGLLAFTQEWVVTEAKADGKSAWVTSRLEFWKYPDWMAQFPFAHSIEMTYRLSAGVLEVATTIENHSLEPMPVSIGFHPYYQLHDAPRDEWKVRLGASEQMALSPALVPTGEKKPNPYAEPLALKDVALDDVFSGLRRGANGHAELSVEGKNQKLTVEFGPRYQVAVVYSPKGRNFICFEPMSGPTNAFNLAHEGKYGELQSVPAGGKWKESFWIKPGGF